MNNVELISMKKPPVANHMGFISYCVLLFFLCIKDKIRSMMVFCFVFSLGRRYDPKTNQWSSDVAPTSTCRTSVGVAVLGGYLYAVGGQDGVSCLNIVER